VVTESPHECLLGSDSINEEDGITFELELSDEDLGYYRKEWPLEEKRRRSILAAISRFADPADMIADAIPGLGFLEDALIAELVRRELEHDIEGYREFCDRRIARRSEVLAECLCLLARQARRRFAGSQTAGAPVLRQ
jgi:uncharacterized membrane protein YkvA (DUF1232 family)